MHYLPCRPDMVLQMAHYVRDRLARDVTNIENPEIYADVRRSLNSRELQPLIDSSVNLDEVERTPTSVGH